MAHTDGLEIRTLYRVEGPETAKVKSIVKYTLFSEDETGNPVDVDVLQLDGWIKGPAECRGNISRVAEGEYCVECCPAVAGVYHLEVTTEGKQIFKKGDITTTVTQHDPRVKERIAFELEGHGLHSGRVGESTEITIRVFDSNKRPTEIDISGLEVDVNGPDQTQASVSSKGSGNYVAVFSVGEVGEYTVEVKYDGRSVIQQPGVKFSDKTSARHSVIAQVPSSDVRVGVAQHFKIQSKDSQGNVIFVGGDEWEAVASGPERVNHLQITDNLDGTYTGEFILPKAGSYSFEVRLRGETASNSPFKVKGV